MRQTDGGALGKASPLRLSPQQLYQACDAAAFPFQTTVELEGLSELMGQMRAVEAVRFGAGNRRVAARVTELGNLGKAFAKEGEQKRNKRRSLAS